MRYKNKTHTLKGFLIGLFFCLIAGVNGCETPTRIHVRGGNPPEIYLRGSGRLMQLFVTGPYSEEEIKSGTSSPALNLWQLDPDRETRDVLLDRLPKIIYGKVPLGFKQIYPDNKEPEKLEEGKYYHIIAPSYGAEDISTRFTVKDGKAIELP